MRTLLDALAPGSYLVATNTTYDLPLTGGGRQVGEAGRHRPVDFWARPRAEFTALFDGLDLVEPGVVPVSEWRAENEPQPRPDPGDVPMWSAVGRLT